jgi:hypothetical protein
MLSEQDKHDLYQQWLQTWLNRQATRKALALLKKTGGSERDLIITQWRISRACYEAAHYRLEDDPGKKYRDGISETKKTLKGLARAARVLKLAAGGDNKGLMWAMAKAEAESGVRLTRMDPKGKVSINKIAEKYFQSLESALEGELPEISGGPFLHKFTIGNLHFDRPIRAGRPITVATMLAFELALHMRRHTAGRADHVMQTGEAMPADGDPCFDVVAAFCTAALSTMLDARQVGENVRQLKQVGLIRWP